MFFGIRQWIYFMQLELSMEAGRRRKYATDCDRHQAIPRNISQLADDHAGEQSDDQ